MKGCEPTYEELKLNIAKEALAKLIGVASLPMRN